ncbi:MAG: hypothetical protein IPM21_03580 [Acidobacteria bacterium]|nr:hypothetical protein [Acidobacteriota bacterium]
MKHLTTTILSILALAMVAAAQAKPQPPPKPMPQSTPPAEQKYKLETDKPFDGKVEFPEVDGWEKSSITRYPTAALGYSVSYDSSENGRVTFYVYNGGLKTISDSLTGPVAGQMTQARSDIAAAADAGYYQNVREIRSGTITIGEGDGVEALYTLYTLSANRTGLESEIYLFVYKNHFIKIRVTRPPTPAGETNEAFDELMNEVIRLFAK